MSDLLGMRLRELDGLMAEAEAADLVGRIDDAEGDMRKIVVFAAEDAAEGPGRACQQEGEAPARAFLRGGHRADGTPR